MVLYMFLSVVATFITEGIIFAGIYFYETEILAGEYRRVWGSSGQGKLALGMLTGLFQLLQALFPISHCPSPPCSAS